MTTKIKQSDMRTSSPEFQENFRNYAEILKSFREKLALVSSHGSEAAVEKHRSRGKLLARERINLLVDQNTPFLELSSFAAYNQYEKCVSFRRNCYRNWSRQRA
jgi:3-methylcrotonyl-CoA carboxylase beta subunit